MRSKWEYIRDACKELGYEVAGDIAGEIEEVLKDIYGYTKTIAWMRDYIKVKEECSTAMDIYILVGSLQYCVACVEEDNDCSSCRFKERTGGCCDDGSLYSIFVEALHREGGW